MSNNDGSDVLADSPHLIARLIRGISHSVGSQRLALQNLSGLMVFNFLAAGLMFVANAYVANVVGKTQFGLFAFAVALGHYAQTAVRFGAERTLVRDIVHEPHLFVELTLGSLLLRSAVFVLCCITLFVWLMTSHSAAGSRWGLAMIVASHGLFSLDFQALYDTWHKMSRHAAYNFIRRASFSAAVFATGHWAPARLTLNSVGLYMLGSTVLYLGLQYSWALKRMEIRRHTTSLAAMAIRLLKQNYWMCLTTLVALSFSSLNQLLLKHFKGAAELGGYAASWQIAMAATLMLQQIARIGNPKMAQITRAEVHKGVRISFVFRYSIVMFAAAAVIGVPAMLCPRLILGWVFKPEYLSAASILRLLGAYVVVYSLGSVASQYVVSARMERIYFGSVVAGGVVSIILCFVLIPRYMGLGAGWSLVISHGLAMLAYWLAMVYHVRKQPR